MAFKDLLPRHCNSGWWLVFVSLVLDHGRSYMHLWGRRDIFVDLVQLKLMGVVPVLLCLVPCCMVGEGVISSVGLKNFTRIGLLLLNESFKATSIFVCNVPLTCLKLICSVFNARTECILCTCSLQLYAWQTLELNEIFYVPLKFSWRKSVHQAFRCTSDLWNANLTWWFIFCFFLWWV